MQAPLRLYIIDDHALFREGLIRLLSSDTGLTVAGSAASATAALQDLATKAVDVLILDYDLGTSNALELMKRLKAEGIAARILLVTAGVPDADALELIHLGVSGIFFKHHEPEDLLRCIREVAAGRLLIDQEYLQRLLGAKRATPGRRSALSDRDRRVLRHLLEGQTNKEIASALRVSESAVKGYLQDLFAKTGVRTRSHLVRVALDEYRGEL